jgi:beta-glucosidase
MTWRNILGDYTNASLSAAARADDLLSRMTLREKAAQLSGIWVYEILEKFKFSAGKAQAKMGVGIGQITRLGGASNFRPEEAAAAANEIQRFLVQSTRLGIPALIHEESCSGYLTRGADVFPQALGIAASFTPGLAEEMGRIIREQMMALGARQALAPLLDITRDPRWGRTEETFGEDRCLVSRMGVAYIRGLQGDSLLDGIVATGKHFVGYGASEGGMNWAPAHIGERELAETYLYPFEAAVREAGLHSIMPGYHELDGIPCHANKKLLDDVLRGEWGFDGLIVSDYFGINMIHDHHGAASDKDYAARMALDAGVDVELPSTDCYGEPLVEAVEKGIVPLENVDRSVRRVLEMKFRLGLFEKPYVDSGGVAAHFRTPKQRAFARRAAEKSIVLLKNDGILPLAKTKKRIAVIGPNADSVRNLLGDYSYPSHVESLLDMKEDNFANTPLPDNMGDVEGSLPEMESVLSCLRKVAPGIEFDYEEGCGVFGGSEEAFKAALAAAERSELVIAVLGDKAGLVDGCSSGEARDRSSLELPGQQEALLAALVETGVPVVVVLISGRPYPLTRVHERLAAVAAAWFPGEEGGAAVASVLFGDVNPAGRTPISFPRSVGQIPVFYAHRPSGGRTHWKGDYVDESTKPLYPFAHGLSYTTFEYSDLEAPAAADTAASFRVALTVKNSGARDGEEVVQLYARDVLSDVTRPVKELIGFARVSLAAGESKRIAFVVSTDRLAFLNRDMQYVVEPGELRVMVGASSEDIRLSASVELTGDLRVVSARKFDTQASVE